MHGRPDRGGQRRKIKQKNANYSVIFMYARWGCGRQQGERRRQVALELSQFQSNHMNVCIAVSYCCYCCDGARECASSSYGVVLLTLDFSVSCGPRPPTWRTDRTGTRGTAPPNC